MNDRFSRRTFVTGTAGLAASLTVPVVASADDEIRIPDSSAGIAERLGAVADGLGSRRRSGGPSANVAGRRWPSR